jgi:hypothetical protein
MLLAAACSRAPQEQSRGRIHLAIGTPGTVDTLKTFVEPEGVFSPGVGSYGVYLRVNGEVPRDVEYGLPADGALIPWSRWRQRDIEVRTELCQVRHVVAARVTVTNRGARATKARVRAEVREVGPAGGSFKRASTKDGAVFVDGHVAVVPAGADLELAPGASRTIGFIAPVLPGRRATGHQWDESTEARLDRGEPGKSGAVQPDLGLAGYKAMNVDALFAEAAAYWKSETFVETPDRRWNEAFNAIPSHIAMTLDAGDALDVAVLNYNTFTRDAVYMIAVLDGKGRHALARRAIGYLLAHPFSGRAQPEADNPGQVLWIAGEHYLQTRDDAWRARIASRVVEIARIIEERPRYVDVDGTRKELIPGACDGIHPEYTEAFDIAGLRAAAMLTNDARWSKLAARRLAEYDERFGKDPAAGYGAYAWPARLYRGHERFANIPAQKPSEWRYFALAAAHQALLAGNRDTAARTLQTHFEEPQLRGWYVLDEGGGSAPGIWPKLRTTWRAEVAMPHGWALAELWLLMRDSLVYEDGDRLVLLAGVPEEWLQQRIAVHNLPTHFGPLSFVYDQGVLTTSGAKPPGGITVGRGSAGSRLPGS